MTGVQPMVAKADSPGTSLFNPIENFGALSY